MQSEDIRQQIPLHHFAFAILLVSLVGIYALGVTGGWQFDDSPNLWGLAYVNDWLTIAYFTLSGEAGPLGRPLALLSFALQANGYPEHPELFLRVNIALHALNFLLVYLVLTLLCRLLWPDEKQARWMALLASALWAFSPLIMPATLVTVQRMTLLSASLVLGGLLIYLWGRLQLPARPARAYLLMFCGACFGTGLAALAKENGALLPALILCVELLLLRPSRARLEGGAARPVYLALAIPSLAILIYLLIAGLLSLGYAHRDFTVMERLLTQGRVLWDYLFALLAPATEHATPFTDDYPVSRGLLNPVSSLISLLGWLAALITAIWLRRWSWVPLFALAWFLVAHSLESSTIALEMRFGHRNYLPSIGPWFLVAWLACMAVARKDLRKWTSIGGWVYLGVIALILLSAASLWGNPRLASEMWHIQRETSIRAAQFVANAHVQENDDRVADRIMARTLEHHPDNIEIKLQRLSFCTSGEEHFRERYDSVDRQIRSDPEIGLGGMAGLAYLASLSVSDYCDHLQPEMIKSLLEASQPDTGMARTTRLATRQRYFALATLALNEDRMDDAMKFSIAALAADPSPFLLIASGQHLVDQLPAQQGLQFVEQLALISPSGSLGRRLWQREVDKLRAGFEL
ncbi:MAG: hypothetical protein JJU31_14475 [Wenzhouxiangella sp.]|nr:hypothetical protein [Wenzhouxiangella sp.]MCH8479079.1 hypothetical protein [Wenzhouxiangella sp.]TVR93714.1 MAG: hypothetical protein EA418_11670 [Wenzhouxiangellaceae bacterium]